MQAKTVLLFCLLATQLLSAQSWSDTAARLDALLNYYKENAPGAQLAISRKGQIIYSSARGLADLEHQVPLTKTSKTEAGSVSKQFTAAAILLLAQQGKLSLNDDVRTFIPELPDYGRKITIRHLMNHTSGLKDWGSIASLTGWPRGTKAYTNDDALQIIIRQQSLNNPPGDEYIYSNSGYTLLTHIVQRVSGLTHADFTRKNIFEPAGMLHTEWRDNHRRVVRDRAIAYSGSDAAFVADMPTEDTYGHGGLLTTAEDLLRWNDHYFSGKLGTAGLLAMQTETQPLNNNRPNNYAAGLVIDTVYGQPVITHSGATAGYRANLDYFPMLGLSIAWLSNRASSPVPGLVAAVRKIFMTSTSQTSEPATTSTYASTAFAPFAGAYREGKTGAGLRVFVQDTMLMSSPNGRMLPVSANMATVGRAKVYFFRQPRRMLMITAAGDSVQYEAVDTARLTAGSSRHYTGTFASEETDSKLTILADGDQLKVKIRNTETPLMPVYKDGFSFPEGELYFQRNKAGNVSRLFISISRARKVMFRKVG